jgi:hypothetical protein
MLLELTHSCFTSQKLFTPDRTSTYVLASPKSLCSRSKHATQFCIIECVVLRDQSYIGHLSTVLKLD